MGFATHLGPWLLGTVKDTTGTTAGTVRNTGATIVAQTNTASFTFAAINSSLTGTAFCLPAGALITGCQFLTSEAYSAAVTVKLTMGGQDIYTATTVTGPAAPYTMAAGTSAAVVALLAFLPAIAALTGHWDDFKEGFMSGISGIKEIFLDAWDSIKEAGMALFDALKVVWQSVVGIVQSVLSVFTDVGGKGGESGKKTQSGWSQIGNIFGVAAKVLANIVKLFGIKRSPLKSQIRFLKEHGNWSWPIFLITPIVRILIKGK